MKDFVEELLYMCSASNQKSRGLYLFITVALVGLLIGAVASLVLLIINIVKGFFSPLFLILFIATVVLFIGTIVWLKRS